MAIAGLEKSNFLSSLTVEPEVMQEKAEAVQVRIYELQRVFQELETAVNRTRNYWIGEAGESHREYYDANKEDIHEMFKRLMETVSDLEQMASEYSKAEKSAEEKAADLPSDVIV